jgi:hypothetical protein
VTSFTLGDLKPGSNYFFNVTAYDQTGLESVKANEVSFFNLPLRPPPPRNLRIILRP